MIDTDLSQFSVLPGRTTDPGEVAPLLERDGAAILTGLASDAQSAASTPRLAFGERIVACPPPVLVDEMGGGTDQRIRIKPLNDITLGLHTDGYSYGDRMPDVMVLLCIEPDGNGGGASMLVDHLALYDALAAEAQKRYLAEFAAGTDLDLTSPGMSTRHGRYVMTTPTGRRVGWLGAQPDVPQPLKTDPDPTRTERSIAELKDMWHAVLTQVRSFRLEQGDALYVDNYRVSHSRQPYDDPRRRLWRVWAWTDRALAVPEGQLSSDTTYA